MPATSRAPELVRLKPADAFDLIHLIARTQSDPRKALAELVQNSLDAGARHVRVTRFSHKGRRALSVWDDGAGVFPELERAEALRRIATTIGASHKAKLSAAERHRQMTLGKYGIGLLGFWSVGKCMEIRSRVKGSEIWVLRLLEEGRDGEVFRQRAGRLPLGETLTEIVITDVHAAAEPQIHLRRLAAYLAGEMRGQLLMRDVRLELHDKVARGLAQKQLLVKPQRFQGVPIGLAPELAVAGFAAARVELYLIPENEGRRGRVALACGGSTVLDDLARIDGDDGERAPWSSGRFEGVVDFPDLTVAPGTRRGFVPNEAAAALLGALPELEARCRDVLAQDAERRRLEREADDAKELRRVFRNLSRSLPQYALFSLRDHAPGETPELETGAAVPGEEGVAPPPGTEAAIELAALPEPTAPPFLFAPGPLATVELKPKRSVMPLDGERRLRAIARDGDGRALAGGIEFRWRLDGIGQLESLGASALFKAPSTPGSATVRVCARQGELVAEAVAEIRVSDALEEPEGSDQGVPDPEPVQAPGESWRSRILEGRWQYNASHPDYRAVQDDLKRRLRYLVHLFAKEVVLRNFGNPADADVLERVVEVLTHVSDLPIKRGTGKGRAENEFGGLGA